MIFIFIDRLVTISILLLFMKFTRTKKLVFLNNKWWVGKTTIAYNVASKFAEKWYKTVIVDLDPQCNISRLALWENFEDSIFSTQTIYDVLKPIITAKGDIDKTIQFQNLKDNLFLLQGSVFLSEYQDLLISAYTGAMAWQPAGYTQTSAINRFLTERWMQDEIDIYIIDVSPSLDLLNRIILLWSDYFITPMMPDAFSLQWINNLGMTLEKWKTAWKNGAKAMATTSSISFSDLLDGEWLFIGYIINSYNQYKKQPIKSHANWMQKIPESVKMFLSEKHCKNGLVKKSWENSLINLKDYWELPTDAQKVAKPISELIPWQDCESAKWTQENLELAREQFEELFINIEGILKKY